MRDLGAFFRAIGRNWISLMSGILSVALWLVAAALDPIPVSARWSFLACGTVALFIACFLAWRDAYREACPYEDETYRHARETFAGLPESLKVILEQLAIRKNMSGEEMLGLLSQRNLPGVSYVDVEKTGFVLRDPVLGRFHLNGQFEKIVPRLVKEWRTKRAP